jgi:adenylosuccinate synthase
MPAHAVLGAQWGDEGKGKIIDVLARDADVVARFSGGNNAGHTVLNEEGKFSFHLIPCGIFWPQVVNVIGNGVVVNPDVLLHEIREIEKLTKVNLQGRLVVSDRAHIVMPYHIVIDKLSEEARGKDALGTTGMGIGPTYSDKAARIGFRLSDLRDLEALYPRLKSVMDHTNAIITKVYEGDAVSVDEVFEKCKKWSAELAPYIGSAEHVMHDALEAGKNVVLEGAQGALLDLDHGTYPYVTSSTSTIGGACVGLGIQPRHISSIIGLFKAYCTRVGSGPFPTELLDETGDRIRELAQEFGATTGRPRRVGWFDAVAAKQSTLINGYTSAVITRLDVLDGFESVKICTAYRIDGEVTHEFPGDVATLAHCEPIYEEWPGWPNPTATVSKFGNLPHEARDYLNRLENLIGCPIEVISTGPGRSETIEVRPVIRI